MGKIKQLEETLRWIENNGNRLNDNTQTNFFDFSRNLFWCTALFCTKPFVSYYYYISIIIIIIIFNESYLLPFLKKTI